MIIAVDESGNPSDENPYILGISVILNEKEYEKHYAKIPMQLFGKFKVLKYSESLPKASRLEGPNAKGIFLEFLSNYITPVSIIIEKYEKIKGELAFLVWGRLVAYHVNEMLLMFKPNDVTVIYDRNPLLTNSEKMLIINNFHKWIKGVKSKIRVYFGGKDEGIWVSSADFIAGLVREELLCIEGKLIEEYCKSVNEWFNHLNPHIYFYTTEDIKKMLFYHK